MSLKLFLAIAASLFAIAGNVPYIIDAVRRRIVPHPYTWFVWSVVSGITLTGQVVKGAGVGALSTATAELFTVGIFLFALRNGFQYVTKIDTIFLAVALLGLIPWLLTKDPTVSVIVAVSVDLVAFVPTFRKGWQHPRTETPILYGSNVLRHILALFSLQSYNIATTLHSLAMVGANILMTGILVLRRNAIPLAMKSKGI